jgi:hypothetical protein
VREVGQAIGRKCGGGRWGRMRRRAMVRRAAGIPRAGGGGRRGSRVREEAATGSRVREKIFSWDPQKLAPISTSWVG